MSKTLLLFSVVIGLSFASRGINPSFLSETIKLPEPIKTGGMPLFEAMKKRHSARDFVDEELSMEQLSQLLWSGYGPNRPDKHKTSPSSRGKYPFDIYAFTRRAVYKYKPDENELEVIMNRDFRGITGTQDYVALASVNIVLVGVLEREAGDLDDVKIMKAKCDLDTGHVAQNMLMYAASEGLKSVPRGMFVEGGILKILNLDSDKHYIPLCLSFGK